MVNYRILLEWLVTSVLKRFVFHADAVTNLGHHTHLLHQVVEVKDKHHLALRVALSDKLLG